MAQVPSAIRTLAVLRILAASAEPLEAAAVAQRLGIPRSSTYHLLNAMIAEGFVAYLPEEQRYGLGVAAFEIGSAYLRQGPLVRLARTVLHRLVDQVQEIAQLGVLHGADTLYLLKEQPRHHATLVTDVGVRLPAQLTASGRSMLCRLSPAQVRATLPWPLADRSGTGPATLTELRRVLSADARRGWSYEHGQVTPGFTTIAAAAFDHTGRPAASVGVTFRSGDRPEATWPDLAAHVQRAASELTRRLSGHSPPGTHLTSGPEGGRQ
ncbi:IclR family transcriptional regulator [Actinocorallia longicatena]|uniref:IclR family transcriptional regulator n=1 Tax=Actinocorallia longicatena TaxID=111803 RepID=A0ABP6Q5B7_9ACTN